VEADQRTAVVTGAGSGIGRATALALAGAGLAVAAVDLDEARARETAGAAGGPVEPFAADVADDAAVRDLARTVCDRLGVPAVVVNCAGWDETRPFTETDRPFWDRVVAINLLGVIGVTHAFLVPMVERGAGGRIVNVASDAGRVGSSGETVYAGAKGGVIAFTKSVAREVARHGITANVVCPGPTDTPLFRAQDERLQQALERAIPMRRLGRPEDVAHAIAFFASQGAGYVTGQVLSVSGGLTMAG
jgi:2-hydroxycyclohexanecarboxyl-CoA dehydrogenase